MQLSFPSPRSPAAAAVGHSEALPFGVSEENAAVTPPCGFPLQIFSQEYINLLLSMYFFVLGILALSHTIR